MTYREIYIKSKSVTWKSVWATRAHTQNALIHYSETIQLDQDSRSSVESTRTGSRCHCAEASSEAGHEAVKVLRNSKHHQ